MTYLDFWRVVGQNDGTIFQEPEQSSSPFTLVSALAAGFMLKSIDKSLNDVE